MGVRQTEDGGVVVECLVLDGLRDRGDGGGQRCRGALLVADLEQVGASRVRKEIRRGFAVVVRQHGDVAADEQWHAEEWRGVADDQRDVVFEGVDRGFLRRVDRDPSAARELELALGERAADDDLVAEFAQLAGMLLDHQRHAETDLVNHAEQQDASRRVAD